MVNAEGWYRDPFEQHELRWFSAGRPTELVRDVDVEAHDAPAEPTWDGPLVAHTPPPTEAEEGGGDLLRSGQIAATGDLVRADEEADAEPYDSAVATDAALDRGAASGLGFG